MKKLPAILMLALLLFNLVGYRVFFELLQEQHKVSIEASLDKDQYNENDLIEIRLPFSMPYQPGETSFERVDGEVNFDGRCYKYVKRKVENGQLVILCIPDYRKTVIDHAQTNFGGGANEYAMAGKKSTDNPVKIISGSEYEETTMHLMQTIPHGSLPLHTGYYAALLTPGFPRFAERPPQVYLS